MVEKKVHEKLRAKNEADITQEVQKLKEELKDLRNSKAANASSAKVARIKVIRKSIARSLTIINEKARQRVKGKTGLFNPKRAQTLRQKLTRAFRRRLTKSQRERQLTKVQKRTSNFPVRKFGLKA